MASSTTACSRCGGQLAPDVRFCPTCGARVAGTPRRLHRRLAESRIAGVCGGIGEYLDVDPTAVRVAYLAVTVLSGVLPGTLLYLVLAFVIPRD